ncbi:histidine phosphatase family protein [Rhodohalobacter sp.]|uniref:SixA phosphatase family protein n=1 Tax=Rhodohalobacter sp. TaxID=1974210 RepID=UPI002ACDE124|nr:histidine phosphatase family protein [Rhodohalobacter sp.]MDZ7758458.1 histidine phosphatase family protein [Rhodohalobacter sp.]
MKKKILIMRHAKSSWSDEKLRDFDRPLNSRGEKDAPKMGRYLKEMGIIPDQIFSSPAERAKLTTLAVAKELGMDSVAIRWDEELYFGNPMAYLNAIRSADQDSSVVMTVGHNPMSAEIMSALSLQSFTHQVPTAALACFEADVENWKDIKQSGCKLLWIVSPKDI